MCKIHQVLTICSFHFRRWKNNPRILVSFSLSFILCFLLTEKAVSFSIQEETAMQLLEPFIWSFGDSYSILLFSLLLLLLFSDMPFLNTSSPFYLYRTSRFVWLCGQLLYIGLSTLLYLTFTLLSTILLCIRNGFIGNMWSETAAILGYSGMGQQVALPSLIKTLELSTPYQSSIHIFFLMLFYTLFLITLMMYLSIRKGYKCAILGIIIVSLFGLLLNRQIFMTVFHLPTTMTYLANVITGWISPLNHATYHMHNFGYDLLPTLGNTYMFFSILISIFFYLSFRAIRQYNFSFIGTEKGA